VFASAVCYAAYLVGNGNVVGRLGATRVTAWATGCACVLALLQMFVMRGAAALLTPVWQVQLLALALSIFATVLPIWLIAEAVRRLGAGPTAVIGSLGPIITVGLAVLFLGESVGVLQLIGAAAVIAGVRLVSTGIA
jgi:drug/metabolite transporter (DMT)-like permease